MIRVLLADDEPMTKLGIRKLMAPLADTYQLATVSNGQEALDYVKTHGCDIVVTDLVMPHMDGIELIHRLGEESFSGAILVLSNYSDFDMVREALVAGAMDYMLKMSITAEGLRAQLDKAAAHIEHKQRQMRDTDEKEKMLAQSRALRMENLLQSYLLSGGETPPAAELCAQWRRGVWLFDILLTRQKPGKPLNARGAMELLASIFEKVAPTLLSPSPEEVVCLLDAEEAERAGYRTREKAEEILRQMSIYCALDAVAFTPRRAEDLSAARERYAQCRRARDVLFYGLGQAVLCPEEVAFSPLPDTWKSAEVAQAIRETRGEEAALRAYVQSLLDECAIRKCAPGDVRMFFFRVIERLRADAGREGERAAKTVIDAQSAPALLTLMIEIVPPLLLSCLPSEAASYKKEVKDAMLFIRFHFCKRLTLDEIAGAVGLNASYLCRVFKKETGENPFAYVNRLRMERAAALISGGEVYVKQVAASVGIDDPFYFTRMFKKHFGVAPSEYLKRNGA